jgi:hypothetical protein
VQAVLEIEHLIKITQDNDWHIQISTMTDKVIFFSVQSEKRLSQL